MRMHEARVVDWGVSCGLGYPSIEETLPSASRFVRYIVMLTPLLGKLDSVLIQIQDQQDNFLYVCEADSKPQDV